MLVAGLGQKLVAGIETLALLAQQQHSPQAVVHPPVLSTDASEELLDTAKGVEKFLNSLRKATQNADGQLDQNAQNQIGALMAINEQVLDGCLKRIQAGEAVPTVMGEYESFLKKQETLFTVVAAGGKKTPMADLPELVNKLVGKSATAGTAALLQEQMRSFITDLTINPDDSKGQKAKKVVLIILGAIGAFVAACAFVAAAAVALTLGLIAKPVVKAFKALISDIITGVDYLYERAAHYIKNAKGMSAEAYKQRVDEIKRSHVFENCAKTFANTVKRTVGDVAQFIQQHQNGEHLQNLANAATAMYRMSGAEAVVDVVKTAAAARKSPNSTQQLYQAHTHFSEERERVRDMSRGVALDQTNEQIKRKMPKIGRKHED